MLILQHEPGEGPGLLDARGARLVHAWEEAIPTEADALVLLGGGACVRDAESLPHLKAELALIESCLAAGRPVLGICLGAQLLARALGGRVEQAPRKEIGFHRVRLLPGADGDALFDGLDDSFVPFHWHGDAFDLPPGATLLASSTLTPVQAFRHGSAWGIQFHPEVRDAELRSMIRTGTDELREEGLDAGALLAQAQRDLPRFEPLARQLFAAWARVALRAARPRS